jgi:hypothetical protein
MFFSARLLFSSSAKIDGKQCSSRQYTPSGNKINVAEEMAFYEKKIGISGSDFAKT